MSNFTVRVKQNLSSAFQQQEEMSVESGSSFSRALVCVKCEQGACCGNGNKGCEAGSVCFVLSSEEDEREMC